MTDKEVLQKAIGIAMDNDYYDENAISTLSALSPVATELEFRGFLFSHDFAEAFFPKEIAKMTWYEELKPYSFEDVESWKVHLMKMVLEENPIDYLRKFIKDEKTNETH